MACPLGCIGHRLSASLQRASFRRQKHALHTSSPIETCTALGVEQPDTEHTLGVAPCKASTYRTTPALSTDLPAVRNGYAFLCVVHGLVLEPEQLKGLPGYCDRAAQAAPRLGGALLSYLPSSYRAALSMECIRLQGWEPSQAIQMQACTQQSWSPPYDSGLILARIAPSSRAWQESKCLRDAR